MAVVWATEQNLLRSALLGGILRNPNIDEILTKKSRTSSTFPEGGQLTRSRSGEEARDSRQGRLAAPQLKGAEQKPVVFP